MDRLAQVLLIAAASVGIIVGVFWIDKNVNIHDKVKQISSATFG